MRNRWVLLCAFSVGCLGLCACDPAAGGPGTGVNRSGENLNPNVIEIAAFMSPNPFGPVGGGTKPGGFKINALYLMAPDSKGGVKGVYADGIIHVYLYTVERPQDGKSERKLAREWIYSPEQAKPYRSMKQTVMGWGYQLHCVWGDADVLGKYVEIEIRFERKDGGVVCSRRYSFRIPKGE